MKQTNKSTLSRKKRRVKSLIKDTITFDIGRLLTKDDVGYYLAELPSKVACTKNGNWATDIASKKVAINNNLKGISDSYEALQED